MELRLEDLRLETITTYDIDGRVSSVEHVVRRLVLDETGANVAPAYTLRVAAPVEDLSALQGKLAAHVDVLTAEAIADTAEAAAPALKLT